jgi:hypothetical protein
MDKVRNPSNSESIIVSVYKKGDKTDRSNYRGISLLSTLYKILSNILLPRLSPYKDEIIGDHQCGFPRNRLTTDQNFCICQILGGDRSTMRQHISHLQASRKLMSQLGGKYCTVFS